MLKDIWKSSTLTLVTAIAAIMTGGLQPSLRVENDSIRNLEGTLALAITHPLRLSIIVRAPASPELPHPVAASNVETQSRTPNEMTWSD